MNKLNAFIRIGLSVLLLSVATIASAEDLNPPQKVIQDTSELLYNIVKNDKEKLANRDYVFQLVNDVLEPRVDLEKISKLVLGKYWRKATDEQKTQFQKEFKDLFVNTYATAFNEFGEWTVHFLPMTLDPTQTRIIVKTEIIQPSRPPVAVNYRMAINKEGKWKAYDVIIEGISMVTNYKSSFATTIKNAGGLDKVIQQLADKNKQSEEAASQLAFDKASSKS